MMNGEKFTCGFFSENETNMVCGTNYGTVFFISMRPTPGRQVAADYCRIENISKLTYGIQFYNILGF